MMEHAHIENPAHTYLVKIRTTTRYGGPNVCEALRDLYPEADISVETVPHDEAEYVSVVGEIRPR